MNSFSNLSQYQKDLVRYNKGLAALTNQKLITKTTALLKEFQNYAKMIDEAHKPRADGKINPRNVRDYIIEMTNIRNELNSIFKHVLKD